MPESFAARLNDRCTIPRHEFPVLAVEQVYVFLAKACDLFGDISDAIAHEEAVLGS